MKQVDLDIEPSLFLHETIEGLSRPPLVGFGFFLTAFLPRFLVPRVSTMARRPRGRKDLLPMLDGAIQVLSLSKDTCVPPVQVVIGSTSALLTMIGVHFSLLYRNELLVHVCLGNHG